jgi:hypothetical protein
MTTDSLPLTFRERLGLFFCVKFLIILLTIINSMRGLPVAAQQPNQWSPPQRVSDVFARFWQLALVVDQNRTVHAFNHQDFDGSQAVEGDSLIVYTTWTLEDGWAAPVDILLPLEAGVIRVQDAWLDHQTGLIHLVFYSGNEMGASIYYTRAPATMAGRASAWSVPKLVGERASSPDTAALAGDDEGNLVIIYGGNRDGNGIYAVYSADEGDTWSDPDPVLLIYDNELVPSGCKLHLGESGQLHAVWDFYNRLGHGLAGHYARLDVVQRQWSEPIELDKAEGLGIRTPNVIEHRGDVFVTYYNGRDNSNWWRRSSDGGRTWTSPARVSSFHVGTNGPISLVVDSNDVLHMFFGQRINSDNHGMWHKVWLGDRWSNIEAVVSGPVSQVPGEEFDPTYANAVVSQGNTVLLTWTTDAQSIVHDVWYSYTVLDTPELPVVAWPTPPPAPTVTPTPTAIPPAPPPTPSHRPSSINQEDMPTEIADSPTVPLILGIVPVVLLIVSIIVVQRSHYYRRH